jgi:hypothetical protein
MVIYKTTNLINGKFYIGKDSKNNPDYIGSGVILERAIKKHGIHNFKKEILEVCSNDAELNEREIYWIKYYKSTDRKIGYNLTEGGTGGDTFKHSRRKTERRKILSNALKSSEKVKSNITSGRYSEQAKEMWKDDSHRTLISNLMKGRNIHWKDKISNSITEWHKNNPMSNETREKFVQNGKNMKGYEFLKVNDELESKIVLNYKNKIGVKSLIKAFNLSRYVIVRILKKHNVYVKNKKGKKKNIDIL